MELLWRRARAFVFFALYFLYGCFFLRLLTDWVSFAVDEGFTSYAAQRIREGQWPHRDFFFFWATGTPALHALLQSLGLSWVGERAVALAAAAATAAIIWREARDWPAPRRWLLGSLLLVWSFNLWNIPYASWYAPPLALLGILSLPRRPLLAGLLFGLSFWFKQNIGLFSALGALIFLLWQNERRAASRFGLALASAIAAPFALFGFAGGAGAFTQAFSQIFLFPLRYPALMGTSPPARELAPSLVAFGLWILSLYTLAPGISGRFPRLLRAIFLAYLVYIIYLSPDRFLLGFFLLGSLATWVLAPVVAWADLPKAERPGFFLWYLPALGIFLQSFPRLDFQHVLFIFPLTAYFLVWSLGRLRTRYQWLSGFAYLPALLLLLGGLYFQARVNLLRTAGREDRVGMISYGSAHRLNQEMAEVAEYLSAQGLSRGGPVLVLPNATSFYRWSGFRNPTPHDQFFPGYVAGFGARTEEVLEKYEAAGGRWLVLQRNSGLETNEPALAAEIQSRYQRLKDFPEHFSLWRRREP